jgi:ethylbenzene dioxygenase subunit beta
VDDINADLETYVQLQRRLYEEARLLDQERYDEWLKLLCDDVNYQMPMPQRRFRRDRAASDEPWPTYIFNDNKDALRMRIARLGSGYVWSEDPANCVRHIVSNIEVFLHDEADSVRVNSIVEIHRDRLDGEFKRLTVSRTDIWRHAQSDYFLARREGVFEHAVVQDSNLNVFF